MTQRSFVATKKNVSYSAHSVQCVYETCSKTQNQPMQVHMHNKFNGNTYYNIKFDCSNVDELLLVCFHIDKQNGNSMLFGHGKMLNDHHQHDPHI